MNRPISPSVRRASLASPHLLGAALAGLLGFAGCSADDSATSPGAGGLPDAGAAGGADAPGEGGTSSNAGQPSGGGTAMAGTTIGGEASFAGLGGSSGGGGTPVAGTPSTFTGSAGLGGEPSLGGGPSSVGAGGTAEVSPHITSSQNVGVMTEAEFKALCDERGGTVEVMPHCGGFATAPGFAYDSTTGLLSEHTCQGANTCAGWNCAIPE